MSISLKNNIDGSTCFWSETQSSNIALHNFCWTKCNQVPADLLLELAVEKEDKKPQVISGDLLKGRKTYFGERSSGILLWCNTTTTIAAFKVKLVLSCIYVRLYLP
jgi:hypothetical protein